ncbi:MAG: glycosyltransferase family 2 protein [Lachnospiraceae bacterium]|nr:glycosyltransferase family 2 protein [Lachnospiraceae bacterium]
MKEVNVSIITVVESNESEIEKCVDSLISQALSDIEIILVDSSYDDSLWEKMSALQREHSDLIKLIKSEEKGITNARNTGIKEATGKYITFVDANDHIRKDLLSRLFLRAKSNGFPEMVSSPIWVTNKNNQVKKCDNVLDIKEQGALSDNEIFIYGRLFKKELFEQSGGFPVFSGDSEICWLYLVMTRIDLTYKIGSAGYYHRELMENVCDVQEVLDISDFIMKNSDNRFKEFTVLYVINRVIKYVEKMPEYKDVFFSYVEKYQKQLADIDNLKTKCFKVYSINRRLEQNNKQIPNVVYIDGFLRRPEDLERYENVFRDEVKIVVLNKDNCDISNSPVVVQEAYEDNNIEFVAKYFAVKKCYETGGIYIDSALVLKSTFDMFKYDPSFFGFEKTGKICDKVFGCHSGSSVFEQILKTYEIKDIYEDKYTCLSKRIKTVLIGCGNITLEPHNIERIQSGFCLYGVEMFVASVPFDDCVSATQYSCDMLSDEEVVCVPKEVLLSYINKCIFQENSQQRKEIGWFKNQRKLDKEKIEKLERMLSSQDKLSANPVKMEKNIILRGIAKIKRVAVRRNKN